MTRDIQEWVWEYMGVFAAELNIPPAALYELRLLDYVRLTRWIDRSHEEQKRQTEKLKP